MNPYFKAARSVLRFLAVGVILIGLLMLSLELLRPRAQGVDISMVKVAGYSLLLLVGITLLATAGKIAASLTDEDEDDADPDSPPDPQDSDG